MNMQEEGDNDDSSESEDDDLVYNPKNLPLGWDGKWVFKPP